MENDCGLCFEYPNIALHAVSTDLNAFPHECLYLILDKNLSGKIMNSKRCFTSSKLVKNSFFILEEDQNEEDSPKNDEDDASENITAIRFVPEDKALLNQLFTAMNDCQALYPDESMSGDEEEDEEEEGEECEDEEHGDEDVHEYDERNFFDADTDPNDIELSVRGQQILRRLNINFQNNSKLIVL